MAIKSKTVRVPLEPSTLRSLRKIANAEDLSVAAIVRRAITAYLAEQSNYSETYAEQPQSGQVA